MTNKIFSLLRLQPAIYLCIGRVWRCCDVVILQRSKKTIIAGVIKPSSSLIYSKQQKHRKKSSISQYQTMLQLYTAAQKGCWLFPALISDQVREKAILRKTIE